MVDIVGQGTDSVKTNGGVQGKMVLRVKVRLGRCAVRASKAQRRAAGTQGRRDAGTQGLGFASPCTQG